MQGARKYVEAIEALTRAGGYGFEEFEDSIKFIRKGNFVFDCDFHARGKTLHIYLLKDMPSLDADEYLLRKEVYSSENALEVYGVVSGNLGWTETYGYLVNNEIKQVLSQILIDAMHDYNALKKSREAEASKEEMDKNTAYAKKVKDFEEFLINSCKENAPSSVKTELQLNRAWIYEEGIDEPIGEKNFVIPADYFSSIFPVFFLDEHDMNDFLDVYEPETDGEAIYRKALVDGKIIEEFDTFYESNVATTPRSSNPVQNAYDILLKARENNDMTLIDDAIGYLGQALDESDNEDENIITLDMITLGLKQGIIIPKVEGDGCRCYIGDYWFYFGGSEFEGIEELSEIPEDVLPTEIKIALDAFIETENHDFETEYMYYYYYLLENLEEESDAE